MTTSHAPSGSSNQALAKAIELLSAGDWQSAHTIVQQEKSTLGSWLHGIVHIVEGDLDNARGWYTRADRAFPGASAVQEELAAARTALAG